jgi:hypothetical protein
VLSHQADDALHTLLRIRGPERRSRPADHMTVDPPVLAVDCPWLGVKQSIEGNRSPVGVLIFWRAWARN